MAKRLLGFSRVLGKMLSCGFRFRYEFEENLGIHGFCPGFTFANLEKRIGIAISPSKIWRKKSKRVKVSNHDSYDPIWGKILVYKEFYLITVAHQQNLLRQHVNIIRWSFVHLLTLLIT